MSSSRACVRGAQLLNETQREGMGLDRALRFYFLNFASFPELPTLALMLT